MKTIEDKKIEAQFTRKVWLASKAPAYSKHDLWLDVVEKKIGKTEYERLWKIALEELN